MALNRSKRASAHRRRHRQPRPVSCERTVESPRRCDHRPPNPLNFNALAPLVAEPATLPTTFERQYDEESHLFDVVGPRFRREGSLGAYDLFFIVRWKANRAITKVAKSLVTVGKSDLETIARQMTSQIAQAPTAREKFMVASETWRLRLPMASAILTVMYPNDFTVYDVRACEILGGFHTIVLRANVESRWLGYLEYKAAVEQHAPAHLSLRDKDRHLWALSRHRGLEAFLRGNDGRQHEQATRTRTPGHARRARGAPS